MSIQLELGFNDAPLRQGLSAAQSRINELQSQITQLNSVIGNTASQEVLRKSLTALAEKQKELKGITNALKGSVKELADETVKASQKINNIPKPKIEGFRITSGVRAAGGDDINALQLRVNQYESSIKRLNSVIGNTRSQTQLTNALAALSQRQAELNKLTRLSAGAFELDTKKKDQAAKVNNQAAFALNNFNRVIQDAPFGLRGIANNIDPLIESFRTLSASTKNTGGAFAALKASFTSGAGIAIAISTVTSLLIAFGDKIFSTKSKVDDAENENIQYAASLDRITSSLDKLRDKIQLETEINKLKNALIGLTGPTLDIANAQEEIKGKGELIGNITPKINELAPAYIKAKLYAQQYVNETNRLEEAQQKIIDQIKSGELKGPVGGFGFSKASIEARKNLTLLYKDFIQTGKINEDLINTIDESEREKIKLTAQSVNKYAALNEQKSKLDNEVKLLELKIQVDRIAQIDQFNAKYFAAYEEEIRISRERFAELKKIYGDIRDRKSIFEEINLFKPAGSLSTFRDSKIIQQRIRDAFTDPSIERQLKIVTSGIFGIPVFTITPQLKINELPKSFFKEFENPEEAPGTKNLSDSAKKNRDILKNIQEDYQEYVNNINNIVKNIKLEGLVSVGQALGEFFATGDIKNSFQSFANFLAGALEGIGRELIKIGLLSDRVKAALSTLFSPTGGTAAIAAGIGLIAAASALRSTLSSGIQPRALGGPVAGGSPYLVGERGPELFVPSVSGTIIPNNEVGSLGNGLASIFSGASRGGTTLRGQDIVLAYARTQRSQLRVNG